MTEPPTRANEPAPALESAGAYRQVQQRVTELLADRDEWADLAVPACPAWTVRQTLSHLCGAAEDVAALNLDGVATDPWTSAQVSRHADHDIATLLALWSDAAAQVEALLPHAPAQPAAQLVFDTVTHEHDIRGAVGVPGERHGDDALEVALTFMTSAAHEAIVGGRLPAVRLSTEHGTWQLGDPAEAPSALRLDVSTFVAIRTLGGRRSVAQFLALPWSGDPEPLLALFEGSPIRPTAGDLVE